MGPERRVDGKQSADTAADNCNIKRDCPVIIESPSKKVRKPVVSKLSCIASNAK
jgi:hypothetical protein